jgi:molybdopterin/thiamine biosynthesis adenylyltransferase
VETRDPMNLNRYHRQMLLPQIGQAGQHRLASSRVLLVGCGALGSVIADQLARAGVGFMRIVDRDIVELTNLQRQVLFDESDVANSLPKAIAAANRLSRVNSSIRIEPIVADVDASNVESFIDVDLILDGTDNVATRYLLNDVSVKHNVPWVYGACVGTEGRVMTIHSGQGPCLRCIFPEPPAPGELQTCDTAGVLGPVASVVGSLQAIAAIKLLSGNPLQRELVWMDLWTNSQIAPVGRTFLSASDVGTPASEIQLDGHKDDRQECLSPRQTRMSAPSGDNSRAGSSRIHVTDTSDAKRADCPTCGLRRFDFLSDTSSRTVQLCGRESVQIRTRSPHRMSSQDLAARLHEFGTTQTTPYFVSCELRDEKPLKLTVFLDGRTIVHGTADTARARAIHARYVGA